MIYDDILIIDHLDYISTGHSHSQQEIETITKYLTEFLKNFKI